MLLNHLVITTVVYVVSRFILSKTKLNSLGYIALLILASSVIPGLLLQQFDLALICLGPLMLCLHLWGFTLWNFLDISRGGEF